MLRSLTAVLVSMALAGCAGDVPEDTTANPGVPSADDPSSAGGAAAGGEENTFNHPDVTPDPFDLLERMQEEGPPRFTSRVHSCPKMRYQTIGRLLESRGVDLSATGETDAGFMWASSDQALGAPNYAARARENLELTTASAAKLFDIFVQAAPEIIANMPNEPACTVGGVGTRMFNDAGQCTADGISCLIGRPATPSHIDLCNEMVQKASTPEKGKLLAVAAIAAAAHTCE